MNVELISYTPDALNLLLRTKGTRLAHDDDPAAWSDEKKMDELAYMRDTIQSSFEFIDYVFRISGTRAFTHQLVRHRHGSYAQETLRGIDAREHAVLKPATIAAQPEAGYVWDRATETLFSGYGWLLDHGIPAQDARGLLPTNIITSIIAKYNLRSMSEMGRLRLCERVQGEMQMLYREMRERVLAVHPWVEPFLQVHCVATGTCLFPRYGKKECQHYDPRMDLDALKEELKAKYWARKLKEAAPVAKDGRTM